MADFHELIVTCIIFLYQIILIFVSYEILVLIIAILIAFNN